jgi:hypothetical protein
MWGLGLVEGLDGRLACVLMGILGIPEWAGVVDKGDCLDTWVLRDQLVEEIELFVVVQVDGGFIREGNVADGLLSASEEVVGHFSIEVEEARDSGEVDEVNGIDSEVDVDAFPSIARPVETKVGVDKSISLQSLLPRLLVGVQYVGNGPSGKVVV